MMGVSCDFWGLSGSHDAALSVVRGHDSILTTGNPTPKSVDPSEGEIRLRAWPFLWVIYLIFRRYLDLE